MTREQNKNSDKKLYFLSENVKWGTLYEREWLCEDEVRTDLRNVMLRPRRRDYIIPSQHHLISRVYNQNKIENCAAIISSRWWRIWDEALSHFSSCSSISAHSSNVRSQWFKIIKSFIDGDRNAATVLVKYRPLNTKRELVLWSITGWEFMTPRWKILDSFLLLKFILHLFSFYRFSEPIL